MTSHGPTVAAASPPAARYAIQRPCAARDPGVLPAARRQLAGIRPTAAATATAGTAAPDPAAAPAIQPGGRGARKRAASPRMMTRPGTMKQTPPRIAPAGPRSRQAQKMASWVEAGPGSRLQAASPSSKSSGGSHCWSVTHSLRSSAMCAGGPPNPTQPIRPHSRAIVVSGTGGGSAGCCSRAA